MLKHDKRVALTLLLIEESSDEQLLLVQALQSDKYRVIVAHDGIEGYTRALMLRPDVILLHTAVSKMDGLTLVRLLKSDPATERTPILLLSTAQDPDARLAGLRCGAVDYVLRPCHPAEMVERVRIHLGLRRNGSPKKRAAESLHAFRDSPEVKAHYADFVLCNGIVTMLTGKLNKPPSAREMAASFGVSERRLTRVVKACLGLTLSEYIHRERMFQAQKLLANSLLSIGDIATESGYSNTANFSTAFKDFAGQTPSRFRKDLHISLR